MIRLKNLIKDIEQTSKTHPDISRKNLYCVLFAEIAKKESKFRKLMQQTIKKRKDLDEKHLTNLVSHVFEFFFIEGVIKDDKGYENYSVKDWEKAVRQILSDEDYYREAVDALKTNKTQTNKYQRYLGPKILINLIYKKEPVLVLDEGCSLNLGLLGLTAGALFKSVDDKTSRGLVNTYLNKRVNIKKGLGVDLFDPVEKEKWIVACNFYPKESKDIPTFKRNYARWKRKADNVSFLEGDIANIDALWRAKRLPLYDIAIASTVLYQLSDSLRKKSIAATRKVLKHPGIYIINDFVDIKDGKLSWGRSWFGGKPSFKTILLTTTSKGFSQPLEFLCWKNARCSEVHEGKDFKRVLELSKVLD